MAFEIYYTSVPRGLKPGSSGFCTVAATEGMPAPMIQRLESLSGYRPLYRLGSPDADKNPVEYAHWRANMGGRVWSILSRVCFAGHDYTQRSNKFAHHVVLEPHEYTTAGPAWLMMQPGVMETRWTGQARILDKPRALPGGESPARPCKLWESVTGDAGWAGVLAESFLLDASKPAYILYPPGMEMLPLIHEALALLTPSYRWRATFSTFFNQAPVDLTCTWRCCATGTVAAKQASALAGRCVVIDLNAKLESPRDSKYVAAARDGRVLKETQKIAASVPTRRKPSQQPSQPQPSQPQPSTAVIPLAATEPEPRWQSDLFKELSESEWSVSAVQRRHQQGRRSRYTRRVPKLILVGCVLSFILSIFLLTQVWQLIKKPELPAEESPSLSQVTAQQADAGTSVAMPSSSIRSDTDKTGTSPESGRTIPSHKALEIPDESLPNESLDPGPVRSRGEDTSTRDPVTPKIFHVYAELPSMIKTNEFGKRRLSDESDTLASSIPPDVTLSLLSPMDHRFRDPTMRLQDNRIHAIVPMTSVLDRKEYEVAAVQIVDRELIWEWLSPKELTPRDINIDALKEQLEAAELQLRSIDGITIQVHFKPEPAVVQALSMGQGLEIPPEWRSPVHFQALWPPPSEWRYIGPVSGHLLLLIKEENCVLISSIGALDNFEDERQIVATSLDIENLKEQVTPFLPDLFEAEQAELQRLNKDVKQATEIIEEMEREGTEVQQQQREELEEQRKREASIESRIARITKHGDTVSAWWDRVNEESIYDRGAIEVTGSAGNNQARLAVLAEDGTVLGVLTVEMK